MINLYDIWYGIQLSVTNLENGYSPDLFFLIYQV